MASSQQRAPLRERALPTRENGMCQSFTSVPRTYIRAADELEPLSPMSRLASLPSLGPCSSRVQSPLHVDHPQHYYRHPSLTPHPSRYSPLGCQLPPKAFPPVLAKSLRPGKLTAKSLDELSILGTVGPLEKQPPGTGLFGKCVLCLLLNAVFVLALFLAFLIGHFAAEAHLPSNKTNASSATQGLAKSAIPIPIPPLSASTKGTNPQRQQGGQHQPELTVEEQREMEFRKNMERSRQRVPTLLEVYPPQLDSDMADPWEEEAEQFLLPPQSPLYQLGNGPVVHRSLAVPGPDIPLIPLPRTVMPRHYNVKLDLTEFYGIVEPPQVRGNLSVLLEAFGNATDDELVFHAGTNIFIQRIRLFRQTESGKAGMEVKSVKRHAERELIRLVLGERMRAGWYWLDMEFRTRICQSEAEGTHCFPGPYSSASSATALPGENADQEPVVAGFATKFEPNFARTFFPGWDEPRFRSTFNVSIRHFSDCRVLTNSAPLLQPKRAKQPQIGGAAAGPFVRTSHFATTPPMPLYLLAFASGPFSPLEVRTTRGNITMNIWSAPQDMLSANFVANFSPAMFDKLQEDFGAKYPLPKMDIFLTPKFPVGGMENWGLIVLHADTVRLSTGDGTLPLTVDSGSSSREERAREQQQQSLVAVDRLAEQYRVEKVITHELVHQWFGNLVGVWDWEELWLTEGFATYFVFDFLNALHHPHLTEHEYYLRLVQLICRQSTDSRSALVRPLRSARQLDRLFDGIQLYTKGAVMVKMLKDLVGPAEFRAGIARFLRENSFQSVDRRAIWAAFPTHADHGADPIRLKDAMEPWLLNKGVPELEVSRSYEDQTIRLEQRPADRNRHLVYLDDESMQRMRMALGGRRRRARRALARRRRRRRGGMALAEQAELYSEREQAAHRDIDGILWWMAEEFEAEEEANGTTTAATFPSSTQKPFDESLFLGGAGRLKDVERNKGKLYKKPTSPGEGRRRHKLAHRWRKPGKQADEGKEEDFDVPPVFSQRHKKGRGQEKEGNGRVRFLPSPMAFDDSKRRQMRAQKEKLAASGKVQLGPLWPIPFSYAFGSIRSPRGQTVRQFWLLNDTVRFVDVGLAKEQHLLANPHWVYAYRVQYDLQNWQMLIQQLHKNHQEVPTMSRMQLLVDGECFLRESAQPQLFVQLLSYLSNEEDLGVLLVGLDSLHALLELFSASEVFGPLLVHFLPVIRQLDRQLVMAAAEGTDPELAALWLLSPLRLAKLYQLRCAANLGTCAESKQVRKWLAYPTALAADNHQQLAAICQHLFAHTGPSEVALLSGLLKQSNSATFAAVIRQLAARCVQDESLVRQAVGEILRTRNVIVYSNTLNNGYTVQYNRKFRELFWTGLAQQLNIHERQVLFAVNTGKSDRMARLLLHSIRSLGELNLVERIVLHQWPDSLRVEMDYLRRKLGWAEREASESIRKHLVEQGRTGGEAMSRVKPP